MGGNNIGSNFYTVQKGDSYWKIAKKLNIPYKEIIKLNGTNNLIHVGDRVILPPSKEPENSIKFIPRTDYDPKKLNVGEITVNGQPVEGEFKSNFFANQKLDALGNVGDKVFINLQGGKEANKNDLNAYSILNKIVANHLNNNSIIVENNGKKRPQNQKEAVEGTDLYNAFTEVNNENFDENGNLIPNENEGNNVQLPTVGKDSNGKTYFVLHADNETLYFDSTGKKVEFKDGAIVSSGETASPKQPIVSNTDSIPSVTEISEFEIPNKYDDKQLNLGAVFINGKPITINKNANFYRNEINNFAEETLNDETASRLDVQLQPGNTMNPKYNDDSADNILKKLLGNNCDKTAIYQDKSNKEALELLRNTDLYKAMVSSAVNGDNFDENGKLKANDKGFNTVQLPALEVDANGTKYYVLHTAEKVLYFNDRGEKI